MYQENYVLKQQWQHAYGV